MSNEHTMTPRRSLAFRFSSTRTLIGISAAALMAALLLPLDGDAGDSPGIDRLLGGNGRSELEQKIGALVFDGGKTYEWKDFAGWGQELYFTGSVKQPPTGSGPSKPLSKVFKCVVCHNHRREDPDLSVSDPEARLAWIEDTGAKISMLQGATLWGVVNRRAFYPDDFAKYHDLCVPAGDDAPWLPCGPILGWCRIGCRTMVPTSLVDATQVCSAYCNVGRYLERWELYSFLAFYWDREITLADLDLTPEQAQRIETVLTAPDPDPAEARELRELLASKYTRKARFTHRGASTTRIEGPVRTPVMTYDDGSTYTGDAQRGKAAWPHICAHCHDRKERPFTAEKAKKFTEDLENFQKMLADGTRHRRKAYMPNYALERLSRQQSADILAYLLNYPAE